MGQSNGKAAKKNRNNKNLGTQKIKNKLFKHTALRNEDPDAAALYKVPMNECSSLMDTQVNDPQIRDSSHILDNKRDQIQLVERTFDISKFEPQDIQIIKQKAEYNIKYKISSGNIKVFGSELSILEFLTWLYDFQNVTPRIQKQNLSNDEVSVSTFHRARKDDILREANLLSVECDLKYDTALVTGLSQNVQKFKDYLCELDKSARKLLYPKYWDFKDANMYSEIEVSNQSKEFQEVLALINIPKVQIAKLIRIQNNYLMSHYITNIGMRQEVNKDSIKRQLLFHGTRTTTPSKIYKNFDTGFDIQYANALGVYGKGLYFAENSRYSHHYSFKAENGNLQVILADVFLGESYQAIEKKVFLKAPEGFDSVYSLKDSFFVIYNNFHSYPLYLIEYQTTYPVRPLKPISKSPQKFHPANSNQPFLNQNMTFGQPAPNKIKDDIKQLYYGRLTPVALTRVKKELAEIQTDQTLYFISIYLPEDKDLKRWIVNLIGPWDSYYEEGVFKIEVIFPSDYPLHAPSLKFQTKVYHPSITNSGEICLGSLTHWNPTLTLKQVILNISAMLGDPSMEIAVVPEISEQYTRNRQEFIAQARLWTEKYAV